MKTRTYTMRARADAAEATRQRIMVATVGLLRSRFRSDIRLDDIAAAAGVSVQTVLRVYGHRSRLIDGAVDEVTRQIGEQLDRAPVGDIAASVSAWFDHYEQFGEVVVRNLADENDPAVAPIVATGRTRHRRRVRRQFAPQLAAKPAAERRQLVDALVCVCDVYTWQLLRHGIGRSRPEAEATMAHMISSVLGGA